MTDLHDMIVPVWEKQNLTIEKAAAYSNIGRNKLRQLTDAKDCTFSQANFSCLQALRSACLDWKNRLFCGIVK